MITARNFDISLKLIERLRCTSSLNHGTDDVIFESSGVTSRPHAAARQLANLWQTKKQVAGTLEPWQNAESLAGAALGV